jgi:uncharacterized protein (TIGR02246 family)
MNTLRTAVLWSTILLMGVAQPVLADTRADIEAATARWIDAFNRKSSADIVRLYAPDAVFLGTSSATLRDSPALVAEYFAGLATLGDASNAVSESRVQVLSEDVAINSGHYVLTRTVEGRITQSPARFSFVYQKRAGQWLIVSHHSSAFPPAR